jgi:hypothetical protein
VAPPAPVVAISPNALVAGQIGTVTGSHWPANAPIQVGIARPGGAVEEWVINTRTDAYGNFSAQFTLNARWRNAGRLDLKAVVANANKLPRAGTTFTALAGGRVIPGGMPMEVGVNYFNGTATIKARGAGWSAGKVVNVAVVSGDGAINVTLASVAVRADGTWEAAFSPAQPWWGRQDLGVRAVTADTAQASVRYLPVTEVVRTSGGTYTARGYNWGANERVVITVTIEGQPEQQLAAFNANTDGAFAVNITLPRIPGTNGNDIVIRSGDGTYTANFDL